MEEFEVDRTLRLFKTLGIASLYAGPTYWAICHYKDRLDVMNISQAISERRSIKSFTDRVISPKEIERLIAAAVLAPNHRMTEPWRFYVLGPEARAEFGRVLGHRKAKRVDAPDAKMAVVEKVYSGFGMELTDAARAAMHAHIDNNPKGKHGKHEYDVAEYGLTREIIEERFAFYTGDDRWPISD